MSFLHLSLLAGLAVTTVPILLHLFGQRQPQMVDFPALRFVQQTAQEKSTSWQLRHILLLLLRILLLAALALALARPRVHSALLGSMLGISGIGVGAAIASVAAAVAWVTKRPATIWLTALVIAILLWSIAGLWAGQALTTGPQVPAADQSAPVAAAIIVDNSPTLAYKANNEIRLDAAKDMASWILEQLPVDSQVGILSEAPIASLSLDPASAKTQIRLIEQRGSHVDLLARLRTALELVISNELERKEVYIITDLMSAAWEGTQDDVRNLLEEYGNEVLVQIIDIGAESPSNWTLGIPEPDFETLPAGADATIRVEVLPPAANSAERLRSEMPTPGSVTVELLKEEINPRLPIIRNGKLELPPVQIVDRKVLNLDSAGSGQSGGSVELLATGLSAGTHHFRLALDRNDPLPLDNVRYLSIVAQEQRPTLVVSSDPDLARDVALIVDPTASSGSPNGRSSNRDNLAKTVRYSQLGQVQLEDYAVVSLIDPPALPQNIVRDLREHVLGGGGLLLSLGNQLAPLESARGNAIGELLPGSLQAVLDFEGSGPLPFLQPVSLSHPVFHVLGEAGGEVPWNLFPVFKAWQLADLQPDCQVLMRLSNNSSPAVLTHQVGRGQIITFLTPLPEIDRPGQPLWNGLWVASDPWPAFALLFGSFRALSGAEQAEVNVTVGQPITLSNDSLSWPSRYELYLPAPNPGTVPESAPTTGSGLSAPALPAAESRRIVADDGVLNLGSFDQAGTFRMRGIGTSPVARGFSVNIPLSDTRMQRIAPERLDQLLGQGNYRLARDRAGIESSVGQARFGRELYPLLMVFVAALFLAEQAMSNRFYQLQFGKA